jgi:hypothetical protein
MTQAADSPNRPGPASVLRFLTELIAWIATPWALQRVSWWLAAAAVLLLIGLPSVFGTPGDKPSDPPVAVPGAVTILLVLLQLVAASVAAWFAWPWWLAVPVTGLAIATVILEQPRWRWLRRH